MKNLSTVSPLAAAATTTVASADTGADMVEDLDEVAAAIAARLPPLPSPGRCLWPLGLLEDPFRWCGARVARRGSPYCRTHRATARRVG
jgi:hypothetical protein